MKTLQWFLAACSIASLAGCSPAQTDGDFVFLRNAGADMPVWVRGNTDSRTLLVWLTGGPGDPSAIDRGAATDRLEEHYGVVYWDQRGSGSAQGNASPETFTMAQFVEDTEKVVALVRHLYEPQRIFLVGHSWGGTLGTAYLLDPERREGIAGWIDVAGNHDMPLVFPMKLGWLEQYAARQALADANAGHWATVRDWAASRPAFTRQNFAQWDAFVSDTNADFHDPNSGFAIDFDLLFRSPDSPFAYLFVNRDYVEDSLFKDDGVMQSMSYSARMNEIETPSLLLWGKYDGIVPLPAGVAAFDSLGTPPERKQLVTFENSAHFPYLEEPTAFVDAVTAFVDGI